MAKTTRINQDDIHNPLHPDLWSGILEDLGVSPDAEEIEVMLAPSDTNKKAE
jgi:hypothetical protein